MVVFRGPPAPKRLPDPFIPFQNVSFPDISSQHVEFKRMYRGFHLVFLT